MTRFVIANQSRETSISVGSWRGFTSVTRTSVGSVESGTPGESGRSRQNSTEPTSIEARTGSVMFTLSIITRPASVSVPFHSPAPVALRRTTLYSCW